MLRRHRVSLLGVLVLAGSASLGQAQVVVRAPFVTVVVGRSCVPGRRMVSVQVPGILDVNVGSPAPVPGLPPPPPVPPASDELPAPRILPSAPAVGPVNIPAAPVRALTVEEFAAAFQPVPGNHEVTLVHPRTGQPVTVQFTLPPGVPKKVRVSRRDLEFDYGRHEVDIRFLLRGRVRVDYD
jgi:hypothetical protein